jgi:hypothetical protein
MIAKPVPILATAVKEMSAAGPPRSGGTTISTDAVALFWRALDAFDYWVRQARLWMLDTLHGPEQETEADRQRGCEREPSQHSGLPRAAGVVPPVTNAPKWGRWLTRVG